MGLVTWARLGMYRLKEKRVRTTPSIAAMPLFLGYLWVLVDDERQTWHDRLAKTIVVYEWDARYEERLVGAVRHLSDSPSGGKQRRNTPAAWPPRATT